MYFLVWWKFIQKDLPRIHILPLQPEQIHWSVKKEKQHGGRGSDDQLFILKVETENQSLQTLSPTRRYSNLQKTDPDEATTKCKGSDDETCPWRRHRIMHYGKITYKGRGRAYYTAGQARRTVQCSPESSYLK